MNVGTRYIVLYTITAGIIYIYSYLNFRFINYSENEKYVVRLQQRLSRVLSVILKFWFTDSEFSMLTPRDMIYREHF